MAFAVSTIFEAVVWITWAFLSVPVYKHNLFTMVFTDLHILYEIAEAATLSFCPGLFDVIQAAAPPSLAFFKALPAKPFGRWGVYAIVLEKPGAEPLVYIGSGTSAKGGLSSRWTQYDNQTMLPRFVFSALQSGYTIVHKGMIVWTPLPAAADVPRFRLLFVAVEAAFSFLFWTMYSRTKDYGMGSCCPWALKEFEYRGLCSHSSLTEGVVGDFDLDADQLEALAAAAKKHHSRYRQRMLVEDPVGFRERDMRNAAAYRESHAEELIERQAVYREENRDTVKANRNRSAAKMKAEKQHHCALCGISCSKPWELERHNKSARHLLRERKTKSGVVQRFRCETCDYGTEKKGVYQNHCGTAKHLKRVADAATI